MWYLTLLITSLCMEHFNSSPHPMPLLVSALIPSWGWGVPRGVGESLSTGAWRQGQRGHQRRLHFAEDLGAETKAVCELPEAQGLQVTRQSCHHPEQQLREVLCLDLDVRLLWMLERHKSYEDLKGQLMNIWKEVITNSTNLFYLFISVNMRLLLNINRCVSCL